MKKLIVVLACMTCLCISGCADSVIEELERAEQEKPFVNVYQDSSLIIYADKDTKVMYVSKNNGYGGTALTVMLDENGNPKLYEGLE